VLLKTLRSANSVVRYVKFSSFTWLKDNSGFFYEGYERPDKLDKMSKEEALKAANWTDEQMIAAGHMAA